MSAGAPDLRSRLAGAVWGHLVGDAMGVPYEFKSPGQCRTPVFGAKGTHAQPPGTWSDDGALMLALLDSLLSRGFSPADQGRRVVGWHERGDYAPGRLVFDVGGTMARAIERLSGGVAATSAGPADENSCGNGSLMRILPVALCGRHLVAPDLVRQARLASRVTHGHVLPQTACALYVLACRSVMAGAAPADALPNAYNILLDVLSRAGDRPALAALATIWDWPGPPAGTGYVVDALWSAYAAFRGSTTYAEAVSDAIRYGHDTDTTAAIAGGLAGLYYGVDAIPAEWREALRSKDIPRHLVDRMLNTV